MRVGQVKHKAAEGARRGDSSLDLVVDAIPETRHRRKVCRAQDGDVIQEALGVAAEEANACTVGKDKRVHQAFKHVGQWEVRQIAILLRRNIRPDRYFYYNRIYICRKDFRGPGEDDSSVIGDKVPVGQHSALGHARCARCVADRRCLQ